MPHWGWTVCSIQIFKTFIYPRCITGHNLVNSITSNGTHVHSFKVALQSTVSLRWKCGPRTSIDSRIILRTNRHGVKRKRKEYCLLSKVIICLRCAGTHTGANTCWALPLVSVRRSACDCCAPRTLTSTWKTLMETQLCTWSSYMTTRFATLLIMSAIKK